jgi:hypothetical protein
MQGLMAPPSRQASRPLMQPAFGPLHPPRGVMSCDAAACPGFDAHVELRRLLWCAVSVLALMVWLVRATGRP